MRGNGKIHSGETFSPTRLADSKIYFGHQSVGDNMIDGIQMYLQSQQAVTLNINNVSGSHAVTDVGFYHAKIGVNGDPLSKILAFKDAMLNGLGAQLDTAGMKLCFWDIRHDTDIDSVLDAYFQTIEDIKRHCPKLSIYHFTVPLMRCSGGIKQKLKKIMGRPIIPELDNIMRNVYNERLAEKIPDKAFVFDIAWQESVKADGSQALFRNGKNTYRCLAAEHTDDGGHLNDRARLLIAKNFIIFLENILAASNHVAGIEA